MPSDFMTPWDFYTQAFGMSARRSALDDAMQAKKEREMREQLQQQYNQDRLAQALQIAQMKDATSQSNTDKNVGARVYNTDQRSDVGYSGQSSRAQTAADALDLKRNIVDDTLANRRDIADQADATKRDLQDERIANRPVVDHKPSSMAEKMRQGAIDTYRQGVQEENAAQAALDAENAKKSILGVGGPIAENISSAQAKMAAAKSKQLQGRMDAQRIEKGFGLAPADAATWSGLPAQPSPVQPGEPVLPTDPSPGSADLTDTAPQFGSDSPAATTTVQPPSTVWRKSKKDGKLYEYDATTKQPTGNVR